MFIARNPVRTYLVAAIAVSVAAIAGTASATQLKSSGRTPPPPVMGLKAAGGGQADGHVETCNNKSSCNLLIAYCIGHGGDWKETGRPGPQGEPTKGQCTYP